MSNQDILNSLFPFLIGKVLTIITPLSEDEAKKWFPFLIGKVLTTAFKPL